MGPVHRVELIPENNPRQSISTAADEPILEAAEREGIPLPFGCRRGFCGTCTGRLIEGDIHYDQPPRALNSARVREGYVLLCIARPRSDCRIEVGARLQAEMVRNPFRSSSPPTRSDSHDSGDSGDP